MYPNELYRYATTLNEEVAKALQQDCEIGDHLVDSTMRALGYCRFDDNDKLRHVLRINGFDPDEFIIYRELPVKLRQ